jgi:hypothetical protein
MGYLTKGKKSLDLLSSAIVTLVLLLGAPSSFADSVEEEKKIKKGSSRQNTEALACDKARQSATKRAKLDCRTNGGLIGSPEFSNCKCNRMGGKPLCSVSVSYQCD